MEETPRVTVLRIDPRTSFVDLVHLGNPSAIGTGVLELSDGIGLIDPGPSTCLVALEHGLDELGFDLADVRAVLLTRGVSSIRYQSRASAPRYDREFGSV